MLPWTHFEPSALKQSFTSTLRSQDGTRRRYTQKRGIRQRPQQRGKEWKAISSSTTMLRNPKSTIEPNPHRHQHNYPESAVTNVAARYCASLFMLSNIRSMYLEKIIANKLPDHGNHPFNIKRLKGNIGTPLPQVKDHSLPERNLNCRSSVFFNQIGPIIPERIYSF